MRPHDILLLLLALAIGFCCGNMFQILLHVHAHRFALDVPCRRGDAMILDGKTYLCSGQEYRIAKP